MKTEAHRDAKYYAITRSGTRVRPKQIERWRRLSDLVDKLINDE